MRGRPVGLCPRRAPDACLGGWHTTGSEETFVLNAERINNPVRQQLMPLLYRQCTVWLRRVG